MTHTHTPGKHPHHDRPGHGPAPEDDTGLAEILDLDALLGAPVLTAALDAASAALGVAPQQIADLGAGTGTGTLALAARFPTARVHGLDASTGMLGRLGSAAVAAGVSDRVVTHLIDLDTDWPAALPGSLDLVWAALSLHHVSDPQAVLRQVFAALRPGGVLLVTEMTGDTVFEPADLGTGRADLGTRLVGALAARGYPVTAEWTTELGAAGFSPVERIESALTAASATATGARYLELLLTRNREILVDGFAAEDLLALDSAIAALSAGSLDLAVTSGRAVWAAVRPVAVPDAPGTNDVAGAESTR